MNCLAENFKNHTFAVEEKQKQIVKSHRNYGRGIANAHAYLNNSSSMKIGIISLPVTFNYGGLLQAFALKTVLQRMGHTATLISPHVENVREWFLPSSKYATLSAIKHFLRVKILNRGRESDAILSQIEWAERSTAMFREFIDNRLCPLSGVQYSDLKPQDYDALIVGSDQVWRPRYFGHRRFRMPQYVTTRYFRNAYLRFARRWNVRRIAYATSFGTDKWEYPWLQTRLCARLARRFDAVSVREQSAVGVVKKRFGVQAQHVLDPTMLLTADDWSALISSFSFNRLAAATPPHHNQLIISYLLNTNDSVKAILTEIERAVKQPATDAFACVDAASGETIKTPVEEWVRRFRDCTYVITDSFHACVFSIIFRKQFIVTGNAERGNARFASLLGTFGLDDRLVTSADDCVKTLLAPIDYDRVAAKLTELREQSMDFLTSNLRAEA